MRARKRDAVMTWRDFVYWFLVIAVALLGLASLIFPWRGSP